MRGGAWRSACPPESRCRCFGPCQTALPVPAIGLLALAALCRETSLVFVAGAALADLTRGRWRAAVMLWALPTAPWIVWRQWLAAHSVPGRVGLGHNFSAPFQGIRSWFERWQDLSDWMRGPETMALLGLVVLAAATVIHLVDRRRLTAVWVAVQAWGRVLVVLPLLGLVVMADSGPRARRAFGIALVAFALSGALLGRIEWRSATRAFARGKVIERSIGLTDDVGPRPNDVRDRTRERAPEPGMDGAPPKAPAPTSRDEGREDMAWRQTGTSR